MTGTILPFPGNPGAPVQPIARPEFGRLPHGYWSRDLKDGLEAAGEDDRAQQENFKRIARELRAARTAHVCPTLRADLAAEIGVIAKLCATAAETAKLCNELKTALSLREHQHLLETLAAEVSPEPAA